VKQFHSLVRAFFLNACYFFLHYHPSQIHHAQLLNICDQNPLNCYGEFLAYDCSHQAIKINNSFWILGTINTKNHQWHSMDKTPRFPQFPSKSFQLKPGNSTGLRYLTAFKFSTVHTIMFWTRQKSQVRIQYALFPAPLHPQERIKTSNLFPHLNAKGYRINLRLS